MEKVDQDKEENRVVEFPTSKIHLALWRVKDILSRDSENKTWYPGWRHAWKSVWDISQGAFVLLSKPYRGDDVRHKLIHECGRTSFISMAELKEIGPEKACPHCNDMQDLSLFGSIEAVQQYVIRVSHGGAYFYSGNSLGMADQIYQWCCLRHHIPYQASFRVFQTNKGETNGCPECARCQCHSHDGRFEG